MGNVVDGIVTLPMLGKRFSKTLLSATAAIRMQCPIKAASIAIEPAVEHALELNGDVILIVEDNRVNQKVASLFLTRAGYQFELANNGKEAVDAIKQGKQYTAILMDCMMPVMDGFTATEEIRRWEIETSAARRLPIIALTASVLDEDINMCFEVGMDDYIAKPFNKDVLLDKLEHFSQAELV